MLKLVWHNISQEKVLGVGCYLLLDVIVTNGILFRVYAAGICPVCLRLLLLGDQCLRFISGNCTCDIMGGLGLMQGSMVTDCLMCFISVLKTRWQFSVMYMQMCRAGICRAGICRILDSAFHPISRRCVNIICLHMLQTGANLIKFWNVFSY